MPEASARSFATMYGMFTYESGDQSEREIGLSRSLTRNNLVCDESRELR